MSTRNIKDAKDLSSGELIYFKGHAKATYMSDGTTVEDAINNIEVGNGGSSGEMNVQSDWNVKDSDSPAYIKNKPTTLEGYGITDCKIDHDAGQIVIGNTTCNIGDTLTGLYPDGDALSIATVNFDNGDALDLGVQYASTNRYGVTKLSSATNSTSTTLAATASAVKSAYDLANGRQEKLVSGTNIKTINGESILGSGNISISGGSSGESKEIVVRDQFDGTGIRFNSNYTAFEPNKIYIYTPPLIDSDVIINSVTPPAGDYGEYSLIFSSAEPTTLYISTPASWYWAKGSSPDEVIDIYTNDDLTHYELSVTASKVDNSFVYRAVLTSFDKRPSLDTEPA